MIDGPTVLVLGAGASKPYGFPSGLDLTRRIVDAIMGNQPLKLRLWEVGHENASIVGFAQDLQRSARTSVDVFLENRPDHLEVGKAAIAAVLLGCESEGTLFRPDGNALHWYQYLRERLGHGSGDLVRNQLSVVTFNYDRSLEQFLFLSPKHSYNKSDEECAKAMEHIPIVHVHGKLGDLPWQSQQGIGYGARVEAETVSRAAAMIKIVSESADSDPEFDQARTLLSNAQHIHFLGFGYHEANVQRLRLSHVSNSIHMTGTALGLSDKEKSRAFALVDRNLAGKAIALRLEEEMDVLQFVRSQFCSL